MCIQANKQESKHTSKQAQSKETPNQSIKEEASKKINKPAKQLTSKMNKQTSKMNNQTSKETPKQAIKQINT